MERAPKARLLTHGFAALRMSTWWPVPLRRVHALNVGARIDVGDRLLRAVRPPLFDNPMSIGLLDERTGSLFSVDAFGAILPAPVQDAADVAEEALSVGMTMWAADDSPWVHLVDRAKFGTALREVETLEPSRVLSSHLPAASGSVTPARSGVRTPQSATAPASTAAFDRLAEDAATPVHCPTRACPWTALRAAAHRAYDPINLRQ